MILPTERVAHPRSLSQGAALAPKPTAPPPGSTLISEDECTADRRMEEPENFPPPNGGTSTPVQMHVFPKVPESGGRFQKVPPALCPPGLSSLTHHGCCWLISGHLSPAPSGQPNASSAESQPLEPGEAPVSFLSPSRGCPRVTGRGNGLLGYQEGSLTSDNPSPS